MDEQVYVSLDNLKENNTLLNEQIETKIPDTSQLVTKADLGNYYKKTETLSTNEIDELIDEQIGNINTILGTLFTPSEQESEE